KEIVSGAHIFTQGDEVTRENDQGYVTSVAYSPTFGHVIGLAFLKNGRARHGETLRVIDHMKSSRTVCVVQDPVQLDPKGELTRG
ncbi:MAG: glycine cleavage T C-terminal barrel domain-containing protein, partial [Pseudomonadota bacterium]